MDVVIVDYGVGNLGSMLNMVKKVGYDGVISGDREEITRARKLILPGVGSFDSGMRNLTERGFVELLSEKVIEKETPVLGVCLGMQLFSAKSEEGLLPGLGWIRAETVAFDKGKLSGRKLPHMGWNTVQAKKESALLRGMPEDARFYFVHSYHLKCYEESDVLLTTQYGYEFAAALERKNIFGTQFHPEKSHRYGMGIIKNFLELQVK